MLSHQTFFFSRAKLLEKCVFFFYPSHDLFPSIRRYNILFCYFFYRDVNRIPTPLHLPTHGQPGFPYKRNNSYLFSFFFFRFDRRGTLRFLIPKTLQSRPPGYGLARFRRACSDIRIIHAHSRTNEVTCVPEWSRTFIESFLVRRSFETLSGLAKKKNPPGVLRTKKKKNTFVP